MNILKLLLGDGIWNAPVLNCMDKENKEKLSKLRTEIQEKLGYNIHEDIIKTVALKRLVECYNTDEIIEALQYYHLLK